MVIPLICLRCGDFAHSGTIGRYRLFFLTGEAFGSAIRCGEGEVSGGSN